MMDMQDELRKDIKRELEYAKTHRVVDMEPFAANVGLLASKREQRDFLEQALAIMPDDVEILIAKARLDTGEDPLKMVAVLPEIVKKGRAYLIRKKWHAKFKGYYWEEARTQPYMRALYVYMSTLIECNMIKRAAAVGEDMMVLDRTDVQGIRHVLLHLYAILEDMKKADTLFKSLGMTWLRDYMPMSLLSFKMGDWEGAEDYLRMAQDANKHLKKVMIAVDNGKGETLTFNRSAFGSDETGTLSEVGAEMEDYDYLWDDNPAFIHWARIILETKRKRK